MVDDGGRERLRSLVAMAREDLVTASRWVLAMFSASLCSQPSASRVASHGPLLRGRSFTTRLGRRQFYNPNPVPSKAMHLLGWDLDLPRADRLDDVVGGATVDSGSDRAPSHGSLLRPCSLAGSRLSLAAP